MIAGDTEDMSYTMSFKTSDNGFSAGEALRFG